MPFKDPKQRRQHDRERRRKERAAVTVEALGTEKKYSSAPALPACPTVADLTAAVAEEINRVRGAKAAVLTRARCVGYLAGVLLKALEVGEIERRLGAIEEKLNVKGRSI